MANATLLKKHTKYERTPIVDETNGQQRLRVICDAYVGGAADCEDVKLGMREAGLYHDFNSTERKAYENLMEKLKEEKEFVLGLRDLL